MKLFKRKNKEPFCAEEYFLEMTMERKKDYYGTLCRMFYKQNIMENARNLTRKYMQKEYEKDYNEFIQKQK